MTNLSDLGLSGNNITDITPLAGLTNLIGLGLDSNNITYLMPLLRLHEAGGLPRWSDVYLNDNPLDLPWVGIFNLMVIGTLREDGVNVHYSAP